MSNPDFRGESDGWFLDAKGVAHSVRAGVVECGISRVALGHETIAEFRGRHEFCPACRDAVVRHWTRKPA